MPSLWVQTVPDARLSKCHFPGGTSYESVITRWSFKPPSVSDG